jgi:RimJ/RimL family protein N-acetyltransferase
MVLNAHQTILQDSHVILRPMIEEDWPILLKWNNDLDVLYYVEGDDVTSRTLKDVQGIYRHISLSGLCFIIDLGSQPIGECCLQQMNLERIKQRYPYADCRRIDLMIGEKALWGQGYGTGVIRLLSKYAFEQEHVDFVFGCDVADYNSGSHRAFQKAGFLLDAAHEQPKGAKAKVCSDYILGKADFR